MGALKEHDMEWHDVHGVKRHHIGMTDELSC